MALNIITWMWGTKYDLRDVIRLRDKVREHLNTEHKFYLFTDNEALVRTQEQLLQLRAPLNPNVETRLIDDLDLCERSCFCRLRMFDREWQRKHNLHGTIVSLDLDIIITRTLDPLFTTISSFKILKGANAANPCPFNASVMLLQTGWHNEVWAEFSKEKAAKIPFYEFPDDQGWIWHKLPKADGWQVGSASGIYAFQKPGWPKGVALPSEARIVAFIGWRKPERFKNVPWIKQYLAA